MYVIKLPQYYRVSSWNYEEKVSFRRTGLLHGIDRSHPVTVMLGAGFSVGRY